LASDLYERNQEIGRALERARKRAKKSIKQCAEVLGTSWRRYREIERGTVYVAAVELEALVSYLSVPPHEVWPTELITAGTRRVVVTIEEGESVQVLVNKPPTVENQVSQ
jgi:transcriptional regulator with XRE-family HTH domain